MLYVHFLQDLSNFPTFSLVDFLLNPAKLPFQIITNQRPFTQTIKNHRQITVFQTSKLPNCCVAARAFLSVL
jgi:hypothetical protein